MVIENCVRTTAVPLGGKGGVGIRDDFYVVVFGKNGVGSGVGGVMVGNGTLEDGEYLKGL